MTTRPLRLALCAALLAPAVPVRAQDIDEAAVPAPAAPIAYCVGREFDAASVGDPDALVSAGTEDEASAPDKPAAKAPPRRTTLAQKQAGLARVARLIEFFRAPGSDDSLRGAFARVVPKSQLKFFASRRRLLNTTYRTIAVIDYTYAVKQPGACPGGMKARRDMLFAKDGLFVEPKTGKFSPWLEKITGRKGGAAPTQAAAEDEAAVEEAGASAGSAFADSYQRMLDRQLKLTRDIAATADPKAKAALLCRRARGYRVLALGALLQKPAKSAPVAAGVDEVAAAENAAQGADLTAAGADEDAATPAADSSGGDAVTEAGWTLPPSKSALSAKELYRKTSDSVVAVRSASGARGGVFGTGSVISDQDNGRVLTNAHVVWNKSAGRPQTTVVVYFKPARITGDRAKDLKDGIPAKIVKLDRAKDLALLALTRRPAKLAPLELGDDSKVETGDPVYAIGHPEQGGLWTLTQGIVSAVKANLTGVAGKDAFQTDASINRGNSGGPLFDAQGRQIGVNSLIARRAGDGLAITSVNFSLKMGFVRKWLDGPGGVEAGDASEGADVAEAGLDEDASSDERGDGSILTVARPYDIDQAAQDREDEVASADGALQSDDLNAAAGDDGAVETASPDEAAAPARAAKPAAKSVDDSMGEILKRRGVGGAGLTNAGAPIAEFASDDSLMTESAVPEPSESAAPDAAVPAQPLPAAPEAVKPGAGKAARPRVLVRPAVPGGCVSPGGGITVPKSLLKKSADARRPG